MKMLAADGNSELGVVKRSRRVDERSTCDRHAAVF